MRLVVPPVDEYVTSLDMGGCSGAVGRCSQKVDSAASETLRHVPVHDVAGLPGVAIRDCSGKLPVFGLDALDVLCGPRVGAETGLSIAVGLVPQALQDSDQRRIVRRPVPTP